MIRTFFLTALVLLTSSGCLAVGTRREEGHSAEETKRRDPAALCAALASHHPGTAYSASRSLFDMGEGAIPFLIEALTDNRTAYGGCGSSALESTFTVSPTAERGHASHVGTVGDHALYLIEAICRRDFYFRDECYLGVPDRVRKELKNRLQSIDLTDGGEEVSDRFLRVLEEFRGDLQRHPH